MMTSRDQITWSWSRHIWLLFQVPISNFCGIWTNFYAENRFFRMLKLNSLHCKSFFEVFALQKNFRIFIVYLVKQNGLFFFFLDSSLLISVKSNNGYCTKKKIYFKKWSRRSCFKIFTITLVMMKIHWMKKQQHILPKFLILCCHQQKMSKTLEFILFFELTHKELKLYQILAHYHFSIKRYRLGNLPVWNHNFLKYSV